MNPYTNGHFDIVIFDKETKTIQLEKDRLFHKWCSVNRQSTFRRMQIDPFISPCTKLKSKWFKNLHIKPDRLNLIEEKLVKSLQHKATQDIFLNRIPMAQALRSTIDKGDLMKLKGICKAKEIVNKTKGNLKIGKRSLLTFHLI